VFLLWLLDKAVNTRPNIFHSFFVHIANYLIFGRDLQQYIEVGKNDKRKHNNNNRLFDEENKMAQAKTLTQNEIDQVLRYITIKNRYAVRNRVMLLTSFYSGMRVGEIASLRVCDVQNEDGTIKNEVRLSATQTKGSVGRVVFLNEKLRTELASYLKQYRAKTATQPLFYTEKREGFTANTLTQWFFWLYKKAGISSASSHSGRRTFITNLANKGVGVRVLASLAGHKSLNTTMIYIDTNDEIKRQAVELI
jgi:integrase/recombinase XerD